MDAAAQLRLLEAAQGDPARLALVTVDIAYPDVLPDERDALKRTLEAAAIPHWFDPDILSVLGEATQVHSDTQIAHLRALAVVEEFPARGSQAFNVHEATRLELRRRLHRKTPRGSGS